MGFLQRNNFTILYLCTFHDGCKQGIDQQNFISFINTEKAFKNYTFLFWDVSD